MCSNSLELPPSILIILLFNVIMKIEMSRVNIPLGGNTEVYTDREDRRYFNYANVRKAAHRSNTKILTFFGIHS